LDDAPGAQVVTVLSSRRGTLGADERQPLAP
jgi:hypothetical protein